MGTVHNAWSEAIDTMHMHMLESFLMLHLVPSTRYSPDSYMVRMVSMASSVRMSVGEEMLNDIYELLDREGPMYVTPISKAIGKPVSTVHKFLNSDKGQSVFTQMEDKRWTITSGMFSAEAWPLATMDGETEIDEEHRKFIERPIENITALLKRVKYYKDMSELCRQRYEFLQRVAERAVKGE
jgi:hypothetical protein